jgi:peptide/nickel transport system permease protein
MLSYILRRIGIMIPVILGILLIVFTINRMSGDPVASLLGGDATEEQIEAERERLGLNDPLPIQFFNYVKGIVTRFDLGTSYLSKRPVSEQIIARLPTTLAITIISLLISSIVGITFGVISALNQNTKVDYILTVAALIVASLPTFWFALMLVLIVSVKLGWLPATGLDSFKSWILPCIVSGLSPVSNLCRTTRSSMLEVIRQDYIRTARSKGIGENKVIFKHALKNALFPVITVFGIIASFSVGGQVVVESIFSIPGIGAYMMESILNRDFPVVQGTVVVLSLLICVINLLVDIAYGFADPRIRARYTKQKRAKKTPASAEAQGVNAA